MRVTRAVGCGGGRGECIILRGKAEGEGLRPLRLKTDLGLDNLEKLGGLDQLDCPVSSLSEKELTGIPNPWVQFVGHSCNKSISDQHTEKCLITGDGSRFHDLYIIHGCS